MNTASKTLAGFAVYLVGMGVGLLLMPNVLLAPLGFPAATDVWIRVVGGLALLLAFYYFQAARTGLRPFAQWSVAGRVAVFALFSVFALTDLAPLSMILLGAVDLAGAGLTAWALAQDSQAQRAGARQTAP